MLKITVAGIGIYADGFDDEFFVRRTKDYAADVNSPDFSVSVKINENIERPRCDIYAVRENRYFCETDTEYVFYDMHKDLCVALIRASKDWSEVSSELSDVSHIGGASNDIRKFNMLGEVFRYRIPEKNGIVYHSSSVLYKDTAVLFTADSGTGKSTHTGLWKKYFGAEIINDDSPAIRIYDDTVTVFGTPWSGTTELNMNVSAPMKALVFIERSEKNYAESVSCGDILPNFVHGMMTRPVYKASMEKAVNVLDNIAKNISFYKLGCNISREAAEIIKNKIFV